MPRRTEVYGPAYLDRILRIDRPLLAPGLGAPLDQSVDGRGEFASNAADGLTVRDSQGSLLAVALPEGWPGPWGTVYLPRPLAPDAGVWTRAVQALSWQDDLGGMGAGFASALGGRLVSVLGPEDDPTSVAVESLLRRAGIAHWPIRVAGQTADWTLLLSSGPFGDKLPIGFRGCHAAVLALPAERLTECDLRIVCSLPNQLAAQALRAPGAAGTRVYALGTQHE